VLACSAGLLSATAREADSIAKENNDFIAYCSRKTAKGLIMSPLIINEKIRTDGLQCPDSGCSPQSDPQPAQCWQFAEPVLN
ncbi:hypothetical protein ACOV11_23840, partial [Vibrio natriegens]